MATNGNFAQQEQYKAADPAAGTDTNTNGNNLSKDEVGWYFVEQYYTTLSKSPEKLHLFYGKRSQFVYGREAEVANVSVGRQAIQERIKALDFQECKVRVSNVDSQASFENIVIQVIGETSHKNTEPKKFVQTFVLAQQPSGYFVLNDILRYISEEDEEEAAVTTDTPAAVVEETAAPAAAVSEPEVVPEPEPAGEVVPADATKFDADAVDEKLQQAASAQVDASVNGEDVSETSKAPEPKVEPAPAAQEVTENLTPETERPKEPSPTPVAKKETAPEPVMPPKPMTWASRAAAAAGPRPVVPLPKTATPPAQNQSKAPAPTPAAASAAAASSAQPAPAAAAPANEAPAKESSGWQTAGADSKRQNRPQSISANVAEKEGTLGYVKYVTEKVQEADLRNALAAHGELSYFDINRQKNCAFVEYRTVEGYQAAITANPHVVNGENIVVEPRRPKSTAYGGNNYGSGRGTAPGGRGRGGFDGSRNTQGSSRGNFSGQGRGRGGAARGRGGAQATSS
ncbi:NTF2 and RRM domain-containing protein [Metarhizium album ARSEF 1941]|uniref:NTF2 and RRM domain-containing protein n=1 Tax=Metarhizium album (strain ARSEF 1941) TaxID=1081103 RepID=A0A0B2X164_METAS|nr:NTF2 and RRM domain-containing protein [Metarhizium album ARSEF 1941]KHN99614.1 NTF2 and RRM domain-containing protein [Metarhizium album ARSEF 1941]